MTNDREPKPAPSQGGDVRVEDMSGQGVGPWKLCVGDYGVAQWPSRPAVYAPEEYAEEVARVLRAALESAQTKIARLEAAIGVENTIALLESASTRPAGVADREALASLRVVRAYVAEFIPRPQQGDAIERIDAMILAASYHPAGTVPLDVLRDLDAETAWAVSERAVAITTRPAVKEILARSVGGVVVEQIAKALADVLAAREAKAAD